MGERLQMLMRQLGLTSAKLAEALDTQPSAISHLISGRNKPSFDLLSKILIAYPQLSPRWLILGEGDMYNDPENLTPRESPKIISPGIAPALTDSREDSDFTIATDLFPEPAKENSGKTSPSSTNSSIQDLSIPVTQEDSSIRQTVRTENRAIKSVIIFYTDGTFESFEHK